MGHHHHGHDHDHHHHHHHHADQGVRNIAIAFVLNLVFAIIELVGGHMTGSLAIQSDAIHDFGDSLSLGFALAMELMGKRRASRHFSYGLRRLSLLSALVNGAVLTVGSIYMLVLAVPKLLHPTTPDTVGMFWLAILGVVINGIAFWRLRHGESMNSKVISWHFIEDALGWVAVLIGSIVMHYADAPIIDPILSVIISIIIFRNVYRNLLQTVRLFLQGAPTNIDLDNVMSRLEGIRNIKSVHDMHIWSLDGESHVLSMHVVVDDSVTHTHLTGLKMSIRELLKEFGKIHATIEFEWNHEVCIDNCTPVPTP